MQGRGPESEEGRGGGGGGQTQSFPHCPSADLRKNIRRMKEVSSRGVGGAAHTTQQPPWCARPVVLESASCKRDGMPPPKSKCRVSRQSNHQLVAPLRGTELWSDGILGRKQDLRTLHERHSASLGTLLDIHSSAVERVRVRHGRKQPRLGRTTFADLTKGATMSVNSGHSRTNTTAPRRGRRAIRCPGHWTCGPKPTGVGRKTRRAAAATSEKRDTPMLCEASQLQRTTCEMERASPNDSK